MDACVRGEADERGKQGQRRTDTTVLLGCPLAQAVFVVVDVPAVAGTGAAIVDTAWTRASVQVEQHCQRVDTSQAEPEADSNCENVSRGCEDCFENLLLISGSIR